MTKIRDIKSEIENLNITIDKAITIWDLNSLNLFFVQFVCILSYKTKEKEKLFTLKSITKLLKNKELKIKNQDKVTANYDK